jgi:bifunctional oligoribonuclease and PAP phosphatase NrnA
MDWEGPGSADALSGAPAGVPETQWEAAVGVLLAAVETAEPVVLACHVSPDGDALGAALACGLALRAAGGQPLVSFSPPMRLPAALSFLAGQDLLMAEDALPRRPTVAAVFDTGSVDRLGALAWLAEAARDVLVVDHHATSTRFGTINLVDPAAASTTMLTAELIDRLGIPWTADIATDLYTGLVTDTGSFKYQATSPAAHVLAARLLAAGVQHAHIARRLWDTHAFGYLHLLGDALSRARLEGPDALVWTWVDRSDLDRAGLDVEEVEPVIDVVRTAEEAEVAVVCKQDADGSWRVSTRSKGRVDVGSACQRLGGGGHRLAAGFTSWTGPEETVGRLRAELAALATEAGMSEAGMSE